MKKTLLLLTLVTGSILITAKAQKVSINIVTQPLWGPVGYDHVDYYYLPDVGAYYSVPKRQFIYLNGKSWVYANSLPPAYATYDLYHGYKVVVNTPTPYLHHDVYYKKYYPYRGKKGQPFIRESHDEKYWQIKEHPQHGKWQQGNGNGKGNGKKGSNHDNGKHHGNNGHKK